MLLTTDPSYMPRGAIFMHVSNLVPLAHSRVSSIISGLNEFMKSLIEMSRHWHSCICFPTICAATRTFSYASLHSTLILISFGSFPAEPTRSVRDATTATHRSGGSSLNKPSNTSSVVTNASALVISHATRPENKTRRQSNCPYENQNKLTLHRDYAILVGVIQSPEHAMHVPEVILVDHPLRRL